MSQATGAERVFEAIIQEWTVALRKKDCLQKRNSSQVQKCSFLNRLWIIMSEHTVHVFSLGHAEWMADFSGCTAYTEALVYILVIIILDNIIIILYSKIFVYGIKSQ